jgi:hypothetical protein
MMTSRDGVIARPKRDAVVASSRAREVPRRRSKPMASCVPSQDVWLHGELGNFVHEVIPSGASQSAPRAH